MEKKKDLVNTEEMIWSTTVDICKRFMTFYPLSIHDVNFKRSIHTKIFRDSGVEFLQFLCKCQSVFYPVDRNGVKVLKPVG